MKYTEGLTSEQRDAVLWLLADQTKRLSKLCSTHDNEVLRLEARLADAERTLRCIEIAPTVAEIAVAGYFRRHPGGTQAEAVLAIAEQDANARLIAAAPDLLEALKALLVMCHSPEPIKLDEALTWRENDERAEAMARAAIAKATADY
jgi:hypothetical protein